MFIGVLVAYRSSIWLTGLSLIFQVGGESKKVAGGKIIFCVSLRWGEGGGEKGRRFRF